MKKLLFILSILTVFNFNILAESNNHHTFHAVYTGNTKQITNYIQENGDVNAADEDGFSLLMTAAWHGKKTIVQVLLANGAVVDQEDTFCKTALIYAADKGHAKVVSLLLRHGADVNKIDELAQWKALDYASARDHYKVVKVILQVKGKVITQADRQKASEKTTSGKIKKLLLRTTQ